MHQASLQDAIGRMLPPQQEASKPQRAELTRSYAIRQAPARASCGWRAGLVRLRRRAGTGERMRNFSSRAATEIHGRGRPLTSQVKSSWIG